MHAFEWLFCDDRIISQSLKWYDTLLFVKFSKKNKKNSESYTKKENLKFLSFRRIWSSALKIYKWSFDHFFGCSHILFATVAKSVCHLFSSFFLSKTTFWPKKHAHTHSSRITFKSVGCCFFFYFCCRCKTVCVHEYVYIHLNSSLPYHTESIFL